MIKELTGDEVVSHDYDMTSNEPRITRHISIAPVKKLALRRQIESPSELADLAGIKYRTAVRYWNGEDLQTLDVDVIEKLMSALEITDIRFLIVVRVTET